MPSSVRFAINNKAAAIPEQDLQAIRAPPDEYEHEGGGFMGQTLVE